MKREATQVAQKILMLDWIVAGNGYFYDMVGTVLRMAWNTKISAKGLDFLYFAKLDLDEVWGWLLGKQPLPSFKDALAKVRQNESKRRMMLISPSIEQSSCSSIVTAKNVR